MRLAGMWTPNEGMEDEYAHQASDILERLAQGEEPRQATVAVFDYWFWEGCLDSAPRQHSLNAVVRALAEHLRYHLS